MPEENEWQEVQSVERDPDDESWVPPEREQPAEAEAEDPELEWVHAFDEKWKRPFEGLAYLGALEDVVNIPYHSFRVRTLTTGEKIKVVALIQPMENSIGYARAYRAAVVAAGLLLVDGRPLLVGQKNLEVISQRYQYLTDNWYDYVIDILFDKIDELEGIVLEVLRELGVYKVRREVVQVEDAENKRRDDDV